MPNKNKPLYFTLFDLERTIAQKDFATFGNQISELFNFLDQGNDLETKLQKDSSGIIHCKHKGLIPINSQMSLQEKLDYYSRLANVFTNYLSDKNHIPDETILVQFVIFKTYISEIFYLSYFGSMDHILFNRGILNENYTLNLKTEQDIKYLYACLCLNSEIQYDPEQIAFAIPHYGVYWYLGMLYAHHHSFNKKIEDNLNKLIDASSMVQKMDFDSTSVELSIGPWMLCSYFDRSDRHQLKKSINIAIRKWVNKQLTPGIEKQLTKQVSATNNIKRIVVMCEKYSSNHAMYRCYHHAISNLKDSYEVTGFVAKNSYDQNSSKDFHHIIEVEDSVVNFATTIKKLIKVKPDLIIFASLGMAKWTIPFANIRAAKIQAMCYGHPASAFSEYIDFGIAAAFPEGPTYQKFVQEKLIMTGTSTHMKRMVDYLPEEIIKPNDNVVRIAINSSLPKISQRLINLLSLVLTHSSIPVEFHFFLIKSSLAFEKAMFKRFASQAIIHHPKPYNDYMKSLSKCNLALGTFPFGGSNTNIDLATLGIPKIIYTEDTGLSSYSDLGICKQMNFPEELFSKSEEELLINLIYLIHNPVERERLAKLISEQDLDQLIFKEKTDYKDPMIKDAIEVIKEIL